MSEVTIREVKTGEASLVSCFYFRLFESQFGFLPNVEQYFLHAAAEIFDDPEGSRLWIAEEDGQIKGSICIVKKGEHKAQLRLFGMDESLQGKHVGTRLMNTAMAFCKEKGYTHIGLWTIDICQAARHLYGKYGFHLTDTKLNTTWAAYPMMEELWEYDATNPVELVPGENALDDMEALIREYTDTIIEQGGEEVQECLKSQHLDDEIRDLMHKYGKPNGRMYVAKLRGEVVGSVCITKNDDVYCEIKRLYIRPAFRGKGISRILMGKAIADAREIGYKYMRLDTFPFMERAIEGYKKVGFYAIERYNDNPAPSAIFLQLDLDYKAK